MVLSFGFLIQNSCACGAPGCAFIAADAKLFYFMKPVAVGVDKPLGNTFQGEM